MRKVLAIIFIVLCPLLFAQQPLNNDAVIKMAKAGLSDDVIITSINSNPGTYDTSTDGLIALKKGKVSDKIVSAIIVKSSGGNAGSGNTGQTLGVPAGVDSVGVYYQDPSGAWQEVTA